MIKILKHGKNGNRTEDITKANHKAIIINIG